MNDSKYQHLQHDYRQKRIQIEAYSGNIKHVQPKYYWINCVQSIHILIFSNSLSNAGISQLSSLVYLLCCYRGCWQNKEIIPTSWHNAQQMSASYQTQTGNMNFYLYTINIWVLLYANFCCVLKPQRLNSTSSKFQPKIFLMSFIFRSSIFDELQNTSSIFDDCLVLEKVEQISGIILSPIFSAAERKCTIGMDGVRTSVRPSVRPSVQTILRNLVDHFVPNLKCTFLIQCRCAPGVTIIHIFDMNNRYPIRDGFSVCPFISPYGNLYLAQKSIYSKHVCHCMLGLCSNCFPTWLGITELCRVDFAVLS